MRIVGIGLADNSEPPPKTRKALARHLRETSTDTITHEKSRFERLDNGKAIQWGRRDMFSLTTPASDVKGTERESAGDRNKNIARWLHLKTALRRRPR
jgi:hypothetical protein